MFLSQRGASAQQIIESQKHCMLRDRNSNPIQLTSNKVTYTFWKASSYFLRSLVKRLFHRLNGRSAFIFFSWLWTKWWTVFKAKSNIALRIVNRLTLIPPNNWFCVSSNFRNLPLWIMRIKNKFFCIKNIMGLKVLSLLFSSFPDTGIIFWRSKQMADELFSLVKNHENIHNHTKTFRRLRWAGLKKQAAVRSGLPVHKRRNALQ